MTNTLSYTLDPKHLRGVAEAYGLTAKQLQAQVRGAINDAAKNAQDTIRDQVAAYVTLKKSSINPRIKIVKRASQKNLTAIVALDRRSRDGGSGGNARPALMSFDGSPKVPRTEAKRTKKGKLSKTGRRAFKTFSYQITKGGGRITLPGGFVQRPKRRFNLQGGGFDQLGAGQGAQAFRRVGPGRYPLVVPRGPSISAIWQSKQNNIGEQSIAHVRGFMVDRLRDRSQTTFNKRFRKVSSN